MNQHNKKVYEYTIKENSLFDKKSNLAFKQKFETFKKDYETRYEDVPNIEQDIVKSLVLRYLNKNSEKLDKI